MEQVAGNMSKTTETAATVGGGRRDVSVKTLKRMLKKAGLKQTGKKATLTRRAKKARLMGGTITGAIEGAQETATGAVKTVGSLLKAPVEGAKAALNGQGRRKH